MLNSSSAIYLQTPPSGSQGRLVSSTTVHPVALFSILDHFLRRSKPEDRVIGTILGIRSPTDNTIEVKSAFAVLHQESEEQVAVDLDYHRTLVELNSKVNPREVVVGWYSTGSELNTYSALIHDFYTKEAAPHQAIHLAINTGVQEGAEIGVKAYVSSPVGVNPRPENCVFVPIPCELRFHQSERSGLDLLLSTSKSATSIATPAQDLENMERSLHDVLSMIDRVLAYVRSVLGGEVEGNERVGKYVLDSLVESESLGLGLVGAGSGAGGENGEKGVLEGLFNAHLQDTLMVSYLASLVRSQVEVSARLALVT